MQYVHELVGENGKWLSDTGGKTCWHCGYKFNHMAATVPTEYIEKGNTYRVVGVFCCWPCAKTWQTARTRWSSPVSTAWLTTMAKQYFGYRKNVIHMAPEEYYFKSGQMTPEQFHATLEEEDSPNETIGPGLLPACLCQVRGVVSETLQSVSSTRTSNILTSTEPIPRPETSRYEEFLKSDEAPKVEATSVPSQPPKRKRKKKTPSTASSSSATAKSSSSSSSGGLTLMRYIKKK